VPGAVAAAVTIATDHGALNFAASDPRLDDLHDLQFDGEPAEAFRLLSRYSQNTNQRPG